MTPRIFCCTYFVQDFSPGLNKLSLWSIKCVLVGYFRAQKGYQCYNPSTRKYFVPADVTFFESVSYFFSRLFNTSETILLPLFVPFLTPASADFSLVLLVGNSEPPALVRYFKYVYTHRQKIPTSEPAPADYFSVDGSPPQPSASLSSLDIPIALRKDNRSCTNHPISKFIFYDHLLSVCFIRVSEYIPRSYEEALLVPTWKWAMDEEMNALVCRETWELILAPPNVVIVGVVGVYTLKFRPNGSVDRYKARLVAKTYT